MAFQNAEVLQYVNESDARGVPTAIVITGQITDDSWTEPWVGAYRIEGAVLAGLPAADPATDGQPTDTRYQAIMSLVLAFVKQKHDELTAFKAAEPVVTPKPADQLSALPQITPAMLPA